MSELEVIDHKKTNNIVDDLKSIIELSQKQAYLLVNITLVKRNWLVGKRIAEEELNGEDRAEYGAEIIKSLSKELTDIYGKGFTKSNLYSFYSFYKTYPNIFQSPIGKSQFLLSWSHYTILLQVKDDKAREWYEKSINRKIMHQESSRGWIAFNMCESIISQSVSLKTFVQTCNNLQWSIIWKK